MTALSCIVQPCHNFESCLIEKKGTLGLSYQNVPCATLISGFDLHAKPWVHGNSSNAESRKYKNLAERKNHC